MAFDRKKRAENMNEEKMALVETLQNVQEEDEVEIDLVEIFYVLLEKVQWIILLAVVCAGLIGAYDFFYAKPQYEATSKLYVLNSKDSAISLADLQIGSQLTSDYMEVFKNWPVHHKVIERLGLNYTYDEIGQKISIKNPSNTRVIYITAKAGTPEEAKLLADTYATVAQEFIADKMETEEPSLFSESLLPTKASSPKKARDVLLGFIIGAVAAAAIIIIRFLMDDRIRTEADISEKVGIPVMGMVPIQDAERDAKDKERQKKIRRKEARK